MSSLPLAATRPRLLQGRTVLQVIPGLEAGGAERTTLDVAAALAEAGARALVASEGGRLVGELQARGGLWLPFPASVKNPVKLLLNARALVGMIAAEGVDLVHARSRAPAWSALLAARRAGVPFVTTWHGNYGGRAPGKRLYNSVMARGDAVIANSNWTADLVASLHPEAGARLRIVHRGTDLVAFDPARVSPGRIERLRRLWAVPPHARVVLLPARITPWKGHRVLLDAAKLLADRVPDLAVVLAGDPQGRDAYARELDARIVEGGLQGLARRVDHVEDMPAALLAAAVVAVPSTEPEAFGRVAVEAQAMGVPVVVSDLGAVPETVLAPPQVAPAARTGWRVSAGNSAALAGAIEEALALRASARDALAARARAHVERAFSLERMTGDTLGIYAALLEGRGGAFRGHGDDGGR